MLVFFLQPLAFGSWLPRIPDIQVRLGAGPAELALALLGLPIGTLLTLPFAGPIVARIGARAAIRIGFLVFLAVVMLPAFSVHIAMLFGALLLTGMAMSVLELGLNIEADEIERSSGRSIMSTCHGCWSLGMTAGSLIGVGLAAFGLPPQVSVALVALVVLVPAQLAARALPAGPRHEAISASKPAGIFMPGPLLLGICVFVLGTTIVEGAAADWSAIYLKQAFAADAAGAGIGYAAFAAMVTVGRLAGDRLKRRFGAVPVARSCVATALLGVALVVLSPAYGPALLGFALAGLGVSVCFPLGVTAAAGIGGRLPAANVAMLSLIALCGFLLGPPVIGFIAEHGGLRLGLACLLPGLGLSVLLAGRLRPQASPVAAPLDAAPAGIAAGEMP